MSAATLALVENLRKWIGHEFAPGAWYLVRQEDVNRFADLTHDQNFLHVDPERAARESPFRATIAHGFFTISLLSHLSKQIPLPDPSPYAGVVNALNYGCDRLRLVAPVKVGSRIRARRKLAEVAMKRPGMIEAAHDITVDIEGEERPACVARWLSILLCAE